MTETPPLLPKANCGRDYRPNHIHRAANACRLDVDRRTDTASYFKPGRINVTLSLLAAFHRTILVLGGAPAFTRRLETLTSGFDKQSGWVHPRAGIVPGKTPAIVLTMQKAMLHGSDIFVGVSEMRSDD